MKFIYSRIEKRLAQFSEEQRVKIWSQALAVWTFVSVALPVCFFLLGKTEPSFDTGNPISPLGVVLTVLGVLLSLVWINADVILICLLAFYPDQNRFKEFRRNFFWVCVFVTMSFVYLAAPFVERLPTAEENSRIPLPFFLLAPVSVMALAVLLGLFATPFAVIVAAWIVPLSLPILLVLYSFFAFLPIFIIQRAGLQRRAVRVIIFLYLFFFLTALILAAVSSVFQIFSEHNVPLLGAILEFSP